ncbi:hypothetical protein CMV_021845 [Castanea mollissima]|uniref:Uncharacterized protein n=1 Tax=Castanea mollissima TaxID=60419 RepID=A0A8J4QKJ5_9ROSI|nr:hypothetical protein CMV_021845 [Castanea mollissima]
MNTGLTICFNRELRINQPPQLNLKALPPTLPLTFFLVLYNRFCHCLKTFKSIQIPLLTMSYVSAAAAGATAAAAWSPICRKQSSCGSSNLSTYEDLEDTETRVKVSRRKRLQK